ncbi:hypothetical protein BDW42DRAFT_189509 [Aspergillus taichungensis]|uniref:Uncharacterized protein n=1 Tax=Aspergillus taichungensis TaxID=482145 RepID=A0A2J5HE06_9EURO|nr:hypothetical protein BDW42DRAFT_189509 [Aspergillus taichungensis]
MKSTLAFVAAAAAAAATAVATALTLKKPPSKQPSPRPICIHPTRTYSRRIGSSNNNDNTTNKKNDNTFHIFKDPTHPSHDTTSLVVFDLPSGQTYQLGFELCSSGTNPNTTNSENNNTEKRFLSTGSQTLDVFSTVGSSSSSPTPSRDRHLARVVVSEGGTEWVGMGGDSGKAPVFDVREGRTVVLEFVGVGDAVEIPKLRI